MFQTKELSLSVYLRRVVLGRRSVCSWGGSQPASASLLLTTIFRSATVCPRVHPATLRLLILIKVADVKRKYIPPYF